MLMIVAITYGGEHVPAWMGLVSGCKRCSPGSWPQEDEAPAPTEALEEQEEETAGSCKFQGSEPDLGASVHAPNAWKFPKITTRLLACWKLLCCSCSAMFHDVWQSLTYLFTFILSFRFVSKQLLINSYGRCCHPSHARSQKKGRHGSMALTTT